MKRWLILLAFAMPVFAHDTLDSTRGRGWSPTGTWLAFNPVNQDNLFIVNLGGHRNFLLKPIGQVALDSANVISLGPKKTTTVSPDPSAADTVTLKIGSPGRGKLEALEWSPTGEALCYSVDRKTRAVFSVVEQTVTTTYASTNALPWLAPAERRVAFEFERSSTNRPAQYWLRVVHPDNSIVKELVFQDPRVVQRLSLLRTTGSTFLAPDQETLIYPIFASNGWRLVTQPVTGNLEPRPLTEITGGAPYEWHLNPDGKTLAVVEGPMAIRIGPITDWAKAERISFSNLTMSVEWSPDGRYLAASDRQNLYVIEFDTKAGKVAGDLKRVSTACNGQFWGWRGSRLIYNESQGHPADLSVIDFATPDLNPQTVVKAKAWRSAPTIRTIAPDGKTFVCLVMEIDGERRVAHELWKIKIEPDAEWMLVHRWIPGSGS